MEESPLLTQLLEEGRTREARRNLERFLVFRFSDVPPPVLARIRELEGIDELEALIDDALAAESLQAFLEHLG